MSVEPVDTARNGDSSQLFQPMAARVSALDWSATLLGPKENWSAALTLAVDMILASGFPMAVRWGPDFVMIYNDGYRAVLGDKHPAALGKPFHEIWPEVQPALRPLHEAILSGKSKAVFSEDRLLRIQRHGDTWEDARFTVSYSPVPDATAPSGIGGVLVAAVETTNRVKADEALRASAQEFRILAAAMPNHAWAAKPDGNIDWFNQRVYEYTGAAPGELDGANWAKVVEPSDLPRAIAAWTQALQTLAPYEVEFRLRRFDGEFRWFIARAAPVLGSTGEATRWIGTNTDVHEQKNTAAKLSQLNASLEQRVADQVAQRDRLWRLSTDIMLIASLDSTVLSINPASERLLGWLESEIVGRSFMELVHVEDRDATMAELAKLNEGQRTFRFENRYRRKDGGYCNLAWTAVPDERFIHGVARDVTAEREAAVALQRTEEALRQSQKMEAVGQLTGGIAHDFNNLLMGVSGSLEMIKARVAQGKTEAIERYLVAAQGAVRRAAALTHRLLAFSRQQTLDPKATNVNRLITDMEELIRRTIGPSIHLSVVGAGGLWPTYADPNQLENALLNLCINARDAMPDGGTLTIETANKWLDDRAAKERELPAGQYVSLCVSDTGTGMSPEIVARAFDPFFTTKPIGKGTGLGLSMIYGFAKQSGGQVRIYSEVGKGTTMCIYLPRHGEEPAAEVDLNGPSVGRNGNGKIVLVVDDEPTIRMLVAEVLGEAGYNVIEAADGPTAMRTLQSNMTVDLLITDVGLPGGMNGRQIADAARHVRPDLDVLFMTGYAENAAIGNGSLEKGMMLITKPFAMEDLASKIESILG